MSNYEVSFSFDIHYSLFDILRFFLKVLGSSSPPIVGEVLFKKGGELRDGY